MAVSQPDPLRTTTETIDDTEYRIRVYDDADHEVRVEVERDLDGERWQFHVDEHGIAHYHTTTAAEDLLATPEIPEWVVLVLHEIGIEEIEQ